jgi:iron complex outermembrane receptor protein
MNNHLIFIMNKLFTLLLIPLLIFGLMTQVSAQNRTVSGKVSDQSGAGIPGVNVLEKGTTNGTVTDVDGKFSLSVGDNATLVFSSVGLKAQEVAVGSQSTINVAMEEDVALLSDVVVVGYGEQDKRDVTGSVVALKTKDFQQGVISSPEQLFQGKAAGVQITQANGEPGGAINIRIRGTSSVRANNNPLFVIDGVPLASDFNTAPGGEGQGLGSSAAKNPLNFLNPNDIASIDILKDASATAIYGARGANGVVLITTKSGSGGKGNLDYSSSVSISTITRKYDLLGREEFLDAYEDLNTPQARADLDKGGNVDWQDEAFRTAISNEQNLSFGAGDTKSNYRFSLGYLDQQGIVDKSNMRRFAARINANKKFMNDKLTLSTQMTISDIRDRGVPITDNSGFEGDLMGAILKFAPSNPIRNANGTFFQPGETEPNPRALLELSRDFTNTIRALGNISAELQITKDLSFKTLIGIDRSFSTRKTAYSRDLVATGISGRGRLFIGDVEVDNRLWENYFTYKKDFGKTRLNALLGYSYQKFGNSGANFAFTNFRTSDLDLMINNLASANQRGAISDNPDPVASAVGRNSFNVQDELQSFFGRVNLSFADKYLFTATLRADGSTRFGGNNKYGYFPSFSFKWRLGDEDFIPSFFDDLALRVGYGVTGNQELPHNLFQQRQRYGDFGLDNGSVVGGGGLSDVAFPNADLKWESTAQINAGIDFGLIKNRLTGSIDYYYRNTTDLLIQVTSAQPAPRPFNWVNLDANVINTGLEIVLNYVAVDKQDFNWDIQFNAAYNKNEVRNFGGLINTGAINGQGLTGAFAQRIANGQPLFSFFLRNFGGYSPDGNQTIYPDGDVQRFLGKGAIPKVTGGITNNFRYKNFDLSFFFTGQFGHYIYNNTQNAFFTAGSLSNGRNVTRDVVGNGEGRLNAPDVSTRFLHKGDFVRLQNATIGYNVKLNNKYVSGLRIFVTGQNLLLIDSYNGQDPEVNTNKALNGVPSLGIDYTAFPRARTFTFGVNAKF